MKKIVTLEKVYKIKTMTKKRYAYTWHLEDVYGFQTPYIDGFSTLFSDSIKIFNELTLVKH